MQRVRFKLGLAVADAAVQHVFMNLPALYDQLVTAIQHDTGVSDTLLHVHAGMAVLLLARIVTRRSLATPIPFLAVCVATLANEIMDRLHYGYFPVGDTLWDIANTLFWPFVLMVGLRFRAAAGQTAGRPGKHSRR